MTQPPPYGDPYGQPGGQPGGQPASWGGPGAPPYAVPADHPQTTTVLILGILGLVLCGLIAPFAWVLGTRVVREIDASGGRIGGRSTANAGRILGIVGTVLLAISVVFLVVVFAIAIIGATHTQLG